MSLSALIQHTTCQIVGQLAKPTAITKLFAPNAVAVIGATERQGSVGKTIVDNLKACQMTKENAKPDQLFDIFPINPSRQVCCELKCYATIEACPKTVDIAIVVTPAKTVASVIESCGKAKVPLAIVISAGFKELGEEGLKLENDLLKIAESYGVRIIGPNCLGVMAPHAALNATFAADHAIPGSIAFLSQSGAMCTAVLDWALDENIGFSAFVSIGSMADVAWADFLEYFERDNNTKSILIYMETIGDVSRFMTAARAVSSRMPVFVIKAGQTDAAASAAASHTGSLVGSHDAFLTAMKRAGVMVLDSIQEMYDVLLVMGKQPQPAARANLSIITNAGGPGVLATDAAAIHHANLHSLRPEIIEELNSILPQAWSHANPIDILGDASATLYAQTLKIVLRDSDSDGVLVILSPQSVTESTLTAKAVVKAVQDCKDQVSKKTILCSWMGSKEVRDGFYFLNSLGIPTFRCPDSAAKIFGKLAKYSHERQHALKKALLDVSPSSELMLHTPVLPDIMCSQAKSLIDSVYADKRSMLTEAESKQLLKIFGIPVAETLIASSSQQAVKFAEEIGYPCVMKLHSSTITHKSDVGGVQLGLKSQQDVEKAWMSIVENLKKYGKEKEHEGVTIQPMLDVSNGTELILGSFTDPQFGSLILFGTGGCMVEIFKDSALALPPLDIIQSQNLINSTKISHALKSKEGSRFNSTDIDKLALLICRFSEMIHHLAPFVSECDINPLLALSNKIVALDARVILKQNLSEQAIHALPAYPQHYSVKYQSQVEARPIKLYITHPGDTHRVIEFAEAYMEHETELNKTSTNEESNATSKLAKNFNLREHMLPHMVFGNYNREYPLCAFDTLAGKIIGCSYLRKVSVNQDFAMLQFAMRPFATVKSFLSQAEFDEITDKLIAQTLFIARTEKIKFILSQVFQESESICMAKAGFEVQKNPQSNLYVCVYGT